MIIRGLGLPSIDYTETGLPSVDTAVLKVLVGDVKKKKYGKAYEFFE